MCLAVVVITGVVLVVADAHLSVRSVSRLVGVSHMLRAALGLCRISYELIRGMYQVPRIDPVGIVVQQVDSPEGGESGREGKSDDNTTSRQHIKTEAFCWMGGAWRCSTFSACYLMSGSLEE